eukprot:3927285-Lingulodinium_polyedra.AAC.1
MVMPSEVRAVGVWPGRLVGVPRHKVLEDVVGLGVPRQRRGLLPGVAVKEASSSPGHQPAQPRRPALSAGCEPTPFSVASSKRWVPGFVVAAAVTRETRDGVLKLNGSSSPKPGGLA